MRSCLAPAAGRSLLQICSGVQPNLPKLSAASSAQGGGESQPLCLCSAGESRWAAGEMSMGVGPKASLPAAAAGSLPRLGVAPTARVSAESQRAFRLLAARSRQPRCEAAWLRLRAGLCCKSARACREISHGPARKVLSGTAKKLMVGPRFSERTPSSANGQTLAWPLRAGVVFYFHRLQKKFIAA